MFHRQVNLPKKHSFFLFGARATGKTTLIGDTFADSYSHTIDLLNLEQEAAMIRDPELLSRVIDSVDKDCFIIDEVQKVPKLLNVVHRKLEECQRKGRPLQFVLTGSSARKLRRGAANLLAGRAFVYNLFPLTSFELGQQFDLRSVLEFGSLPQCITTKEVEAKRRYLESYSLTYVKEEVWNEQLVRKLEPFSNFLEVAAQMNGEVLNFAAIGRDIGVDIKTVQSYFSILDDTLVGFLLPPYHRSVRKRQLTNPRFYFFDLGVKRAIERTLSVELVPQTYAFGKAFEHFLILEMYRLNEYKKLDYRFSYLTTHDGSEVDLVIERPGKSVALVEIKSATRVQPGMVKHLENFRSDFKNCDTFCLSLDPNHQLIEKTKALPWEAGLKELGF